VFQVYHTRSRSRRQRYARVFVAIVAAYAWVVFAGVLSKFFFYPRPLFFVVFFFVFGGSTSTRIAFFVAAIVGGGRRPFPGTGGLHCGLLGVAFPPRVEALAATFVCGGCCEPSGRHGGSAAPS
jgi:RsiW-degrading membrane proteinase PrsW (M82 family)